MERQGLALDRKDLEGRLGFPMPGGVEVREDVTGDAVYVYADPRPEPVAVFSAADATPAVLGAAVRRAARVVADAFFAP